MTRRDLLLFGLVLLAAAAAAAPVDHPAQLAPLTPTSTFPRFTPAELASAGFPDHLHAHAWPGWQPLVDAAGETYGPLTLAQGTLLLPRPGLDMQPGEICYRGIHLIHAPQFPVTALLPFVELTDWARRELPPLIGHDRTDTLRLRSPESLDAYVALTGQKFWRLFAWRDGECIIEPASILAARTLDAHAAFALVTEWLLDDAAGDDDAFPAWFRAGLGSYFAEDGVHLVNYAAEFRIAGQAVVFAAARTDSVLSAPAGADDELDRRMYRTASYSAFLMIWELVEHRGGLSALQQLVQAVAAGAEPDAACRDAYGLSWADLTTSLDPTGRPEPVGDAVQPRAPHVRPTGG
jgi:hypothetical protein